MPGLCGFTISLPANRTRETVLARMQASLVYRSHHIATPCFCDRFIASAGVHLQQTGSSQEPFSGSDCSVWIDGEFYPSVKAPVRRPAEILAGEYAGGTLLSFLKKVDGIFAAVIYDHKKQLLHIISDRYGLRHLYIATSGNGIAWASEIKAFRCITGLSLEVSPAALNEFLQHGHFTANHTWFDAVRLHDPATIFSVNLNDCTSSRTVYWNFSDISLLENIPSSAALASQLGERFTAAVKKRCGSDERIGLGLSGGLDSRAIFAAMPSGSHPLYAVTFGRENCPDIRIAARVAALRPSRHVIHTINEANWLNNRFCGIWLTDGQISLLHMHGIEQIDDFKDYYDIELNGFLGDALLGGSYSAAPEGELERFHHRGRRLIATALTLGNLSYHTRIPFFDNDLLEFTLSIPVSMRKNSFIYNKMLLNKFPAYFDTIPWQKSGLPISRTGTMWDAVRLMRKGFNKLQSFIPGMNNRSDYFNYASWIRKEPARSKFEDLLFSNNALLYQYADKKIITKELRHHLSGGNKTEMLCRYMTAEIWMRQFFRNEYMT